MGRPIKELADAIQRQDVKWLTTLPGIGKTTAEQIVATLKTKMTKFAMMSGPIATSAEGETQGMSALVAAIFDDAYSALLTLGLAPMDARNRLDLVAKSGQQCDNVESVIELVFKKAK